MLRGVCFKIERDLLDLLDKYAMNHNMTRSEVIRRAIAMLVKEEREKEIPRAKMIKIKL